MKTSTKSTLRGMDCVGGEDKDYDDTPSEEQNPSDSDSGNDSK